jgi:hypothetical protein
MIHLVYFSISKVAYGVLVKSQYVVAVESIVLRWYKKYH